MTREEMNLIRGFVANIQSLKDAHNTEQLPINYGTICTITANGWKLIEELKALQQQPCENCISRDSAIKAMDYDIKSFEFKSGVSRYMDDIAKLLNTIYEIQVNNIKALPSVIPQETKTGHWIKPKGKVKPFGDDTIQCDMCGFFTDVDCNYNYCPNCGCRMVEPQESEG